MKTLLVRLAIFAALFSAFVVYFGRAPDYRIEWNREVPSKEKLTTLEGAINDTRNWSIFHHALKAVSFSENGKPVLEGTPIKPGMEALFQFEPKDKAWKRFDIRASVLEVVPDQSVKFALTSESSGKTTRVVDSLEWWLSLRPATEEESKRGYHAFVIGGATALTKSARARFFGRVSPKILMNQLYQVDLVKLANYTANVVAIKNGTEPVYQ